MKMTLLLAAVLLLCSPAWAEDQPKVYNENDLNKYGASSSGDLNRSQLSAKEAKQLIDDAIRIAGDKTLSDEMRCIKLEYASELMSHQQPHVTQAQKESLQRIRNIIEEGCKSLRPKYVTIQGKEVRLGISSGEARQIFGKPKSINISGGTYGQHEQWVYQDPYKSRYRKNTYSGEFNLYFENDKLVSYQEY